jgi:hypothetical protein
MLYKIKKCTVIPNFNYKGLNVPVSVCDAVKSCKCIQKFRESLLSPLTYLLTDLLTYLLTPCSRVLLDKLTVLQLSRNSPHFMEPDD